MSSPTKHTFVDRSPINVARFDFVSIRLVCLCAEHGSLSAAAPRAPMSIAGASHRLARLESNLGTKLFVRHRKGLRITPAGARFVAGANAILELLKQISAVAAESQLDSADELRLKHMRPSTRTGWRGRYEGARQLL